LKCPSLALRPGQGPTSQGHSAGEAAGTRKGIPRLARRDTGVFYKEPLRGTLFEKDAVAALDDRGGTRPCGSHPVRLAPFVRTPAPPAI
jgi:hypothetical protein